MLLLAAAAVAGLAWSGILVPFLPSGHEAGEGHNPPPKITDATTAPSSSAPAATAAAPERQQPPAQEAESTAAADSEAQSLRDSLTRAKADADARVAAVTKRIEELEKAQAAKVQDLTKRLEAAEKRLAASNAATAAAAGSAATGTGTAQAPRQIPITNQPAPTQEAQPTSQTGQDTAEAPASSRNDPVIASTDPAATPLPQPRPADLGNSISVVRPRESQQTASVPSSPVLRSWVLRDVYSGVALIEGRYGMIEVVEGSVLPGGGIVEDIRRAGGRWIVTTNRGIIASGR
jgi:hypothetical protein